MAWEAISAERNGAIYIYLVNEAQMGCSGHGQVL